MFWVLDLTFPLQSAELCLHLENLIFAGERSLYRSTSSRCGVLVGFGFLFFGGDFLLCPTSCFKSILAPRMFPSAGILTSQPGRERYVWLQNCLILPPRWVCWVNCLLRAGSPSSESFPMRGCNSRKRWRGMGWNAQRHKPSCYLQLVQESILFRWAYRWMELKSDKWASRPCCVLGAGVRQDEATVDQADRQTLCWLLGKGNSCLSQQSPNTPEERQSWRWGLLLFQCQRTTLFFC